MTSNQAVHNCYILGEQCMAKNNFSGAVSAYSGAIALDPNYSDAYLARGIARREAGDYDGAIADWMEVARLEPLNADVYCWCADIRYEYNNDYDRAMADYSKALDIFPEFSEARFKRACARLEHHDYDGAIADFTKMLEVEEDAYCYMMRGKANAAQGAYQSAIADCTISIDLDPDSKMNAITYYDRAYYRAALKDYRGAAEDAQRFLAFGFKWPQVETIRKALQAWQQGKAEA
ncbi:MAG TPA: tetratricopeptide repeat protein [Aggregatilineales bacterium]|nr:tetratricopeptide repeat protein [Aggregatilineales bacterium]